MSSENSIAQTGRAVEPPVSETERPQAGFGIPKELLKQYEVRTLSHDDNAERRIGLFKPENPKSPALEIAGDRIVAHQGDPETVESLVKLAQHNGWEGITVDGSPEFRKAVWHEAARAGLEVNGYEPTFEERETVDRQRREDAERARQDAERLRKDGKEEKDAEAEHIVEVAEIVMEATHASPAVALAADLAKADMSAEGKLAASPEQGESLADVSDLLKRKAALVYELNEVLRENPALADQSVSHFVMKQGASQLALADAGASNEVLASRNLMTETFVAEAGRDETNLTKTVNEYLRDQGFEIDELALSRGLRVPDGKTARDELVADALQERRAFDEFLAKKDHRPGAERESERLANLFLTGTQAEREAEPKLANALNAEAEMRRHLEAAFEGNGNRIETVSLEGRQMISDVLRRGLDVSVREPTPVRQIEPTPTPPPPNGTVISWRRT